MPAIGGGTFADVDGNIEDGTLQDTDKLCLGEGRRLEMQAPYGANLP